MANDVADEHFLVNGRMVFDNGVTRIWYCATCGWWRAWHMERCTVCGTTRDGVPQRAAMAAKAAS